MHVWGVGGGLRSAQALWVAGPVLLGHLGTARGFCHSLGPTSVPQHTREFDLTVVPPEAGNREHFRTLALARGSVPGGGALCARRWSVQSPVGSPGCDVFQASGWSPEPLPPGRGGGCGPLGKRGARCAGGSPRDPPPPAGVGVN